jgi:putative endonuclease
MVDRRRELGDAGETAVARWYENAGYVVVDRNWRCRDGELDLVLSAAGVVVFCEVKTRRGDTFGAPFEAVTAAKRRRIRGLAVRWLAEHAHGAGGEIRFDVASVRAAPGAPATIEVIQAAF